VRVYRRDVADDFDVVIAGAGPGGAALGAILGRRGVSTLILDRATFPRAKPCGGGLTGHATEAMAAAGLELRVAHTASPDARVRFGGFERSVALPRPVHVVRREEFDASLVDQVRAAGVEVREGTPVEGFEVDADGVTVTTSKGKVRGRVLVGADGAGSLVRKRLVRRDPVPIRLFRGELPAPPDWRGRSEMVYDFTPMTRGMRGYLWVFPVPGDRLNVGVMHYPGTRIGGAGLIEHLREGLREHGIELDAGAAGCVRGWPAWGYVPATPVAAPRLLTIGDAAGIDALTGEGIAVAMEHALVAGEAIGRALATGDFRFAAYRRALRRATVGRELNLDRWLARLLYGGSGGRWRSWLSLVLYDPQVLELYAARVAGGLVLADHKLRLFGALFRHAGQWRARRRMLATAGAARQLTAGAGPALSADG
jgi:menaquinone-9 beta-reductase